MQIFIFEIKRQLSDILLWTAIVCVVLVLMIYGFYPIFLDSRPAVEQMLSAMPEGFAAAFGLNVDDLFSYQSFSSMVYLYESLLGSIMAAKTAVAVFGREKQNQCQDFLFSKPVSRKSIFIQKLMCCAVSMLIVSIPYVILFIGGYYHYTESVQITSSLLLSAVGMPLTMILFTAIGITAVVFLHRIRSASGMGTGIGLAAFLLSVLYSLTERDFFKYISPLSYFNPSEVARFAHFDPICIGLALLIICGLGMASYIRCIKEDV